jgi:hypothetical protein
MMRSFHQAVDAVIKCRLEEMKDHSSSLWATARFKKKQFDATFLTKRFLNRFAINGQPLSEEDKKRVFNRIMGAATFRMLPKEEQHQILMVCFRRKSNTRS